MKGTGAAVAAVLIAAGCTGGGGSAGADSQPATEQGLLDTARANAEAFVSEPGDTYDFLSADCQRILSRSEWAGQVAIGSSFFESIYGFELSDLTIADVEVVQFDGTTGSVQVTSTGPDGEPIGDEAPAPWRYDQDRWVTDDCETLDSSQDGSGSVSSETALGWPAKFCRLTEGNTRAEVREIMGEPTSEFLDSNSQDSWEAYQFNITVFYTQPRAQDPDPMKVTVSSLSADSTGQFTDMTSEDIALFPCADRVFGDDIIAAAAANG